MATWRCLLSEGVRTSNNPTPYEVAYGKILRTRVLMLVLNLELLGHLFNLVALRRPLFEGPLPRGNLFRLDRITLQRSL